MGSEMCIRDRPAGVRLPYDAPMLTTYRDMADLLALDPPMPRLEDIVWDDPGGTKLT